MLDENDAPRNLALVQGAYYLATGVWPLVSMQSFEAVTGRKTDHWLVNTVGVLVAVLGGALIGSALRGGPSRDLQATAAAGALALGGVDTYYAARGRISKIYLADAAAEAALVALWCRAALSSSAREAAEEPAARRA